MDDINYWDRLEASQFECAVLTRHVPGTTSTNGRNQGAYWAITHDKRHAMLVFLPTETSLKDAPKFDAFSIEQGYEKSCASYYLLIALLDDSVFDEFSYVCTGIADAIQQVQPRSYAKRVKEKLSRWASLMRTSQAMRHNIEQGLVGELTLLEEIIPICGALETISGWRGPLCKSQDFVIGRTAIEVKSKMRDTKSSWVTINGMKQLDVHKGESLFLYVARLDNVPNGDTLPELVERIGEVISCENVVAGRLYRDRLLDYGYAESRVSDDRWVALEPYCYEVVDEFPSITRKKLRAWQDGLSLKSYSIDLDVCNEKGFERDVSVILDSLPGKQKCCEIQNSLF